MQGAADQVWNEPLKDQAQMEGNGDSGQNKPEQARTGMSGSTRSKRAWTRSILQSFDKWRR